MELTKFIDELFDVNRINRANIIKIFHVFFIISFILCFLIAYLFGVFVGVGFICFIFLMECFFRACLPFVFAMKNACLKKKGESHVFQGKK
ncbi:MULTISPECIES: hypothetical protein [Moraxella]|uniref:Uncharacterized protein n=1 Tax=Moraxella lacunata TaxID=477 RepID=A0A1B8Q4L5_MORLA|nr:MULTISPECIES: hypothetical protein [Moraxella]MBE9578411.1 hypothetical protein [Moraxella sp. K1664]MBE9587779.1 hypothetical protein [Moraxella sp. K1630]MDH9218294.1 hypothetical protein [Moraxella lacunata]MDI4506860.1 hypothetical protein [Moraxella lacunata]OBX62918.1 hypothetical protein A9Z63_00600 [Moraxella lacunata]